MNRTSNSSKQFATSAWPVLSPKLQGNQNRHMLGFSLLSNTKKKNLLNPKSHTGDHLLLLVLLLLRFTWIPKQRDMQSWHETTKPIQNCKVSLTYPQPNSNDVRTHTGWLLLARLRKVQNGLQIDGNILRCQVWSGKKASTHRSTSSSPPALGVSNDAFWMKLWWMTVLWTQERMRISGWDFVDGWGSGILQRYLAWSKWLTLALGMVVDVRRVYILGLGCWI